MISLVTFEDWKQALHGASRQSVDLNSVVAVSIHADAGLVMPAELPPLSESVARASFDQIKWLLSQGIAEPILRPATSSLETFSDKFALGNVSPSKMEAFLSKYHNQAFAVFAVGAIFLLWTM
jgi:hypothetical protein